MQTQRLIEASARDPSLLTFAIMRHDGVVQPHPPVGQALMLMEQTLSKCGHQVGTIW